MARIIIGFVFLGMAALVFPAVMLVLAEVEKPVSQRAAWVSSLVPKTTRLKAHSHRPGSYPRYLLRPFCKQENGIRKCGYKNRAGTTVIEPVFEEADRFYRNNPTRVRIGGKYGYIDRRGNFVVRPRFDWADRFTNKKFTVAGAGGHLYRINHSGKVYEPDKLVQDVRLLWPQTLAIKKGGKWGITDFDGNEILEFRYDEIGTVAKPPAIRKRRVTPYSPAVLIRIGQKWGYAHPLGKHLRILEPQFEEAEAYRGKPVIVRQDGKYGILTMKGYWFLTPRLETRPEVVRPGGTRGWRNTVMIKVGSRYGVIDTRGRFVLQPVFDELRCFDKNTGGILVRKDGKWGMVNSHGTALTAIRYDSIGCFKGQECFTKVTENGEVYRLDRFGNRVADGTPDGARYCKPGLKARQANLPRFLKRRSLRTRSYPFHSRFRRF